MPSPGTHHRHDGDGWVECSFGGEAHRHWGRYGAAGLLLARRSPAGSADSMGSAGSTGSADSTGSAGPVDEVVLQQRALWSHFGGTWGIPGGALAAGEDVVAGALREAGEEAGIVAEHVRVVGRHVLDHGVWRYTTVVAEVADGVDVEPAVTDPESLAVRWVPVAETARLPLLPAFEAALPALMALLGGRSGLDA